MQPKEMEQPVMIVTGQTLYQRMLRCHPYPTGIIVVDSPEDLSLLLKDNLDALLCLDLSLFHDDVEDSLLHLILKDAFEQLVVVMTKEPDAKKLLRLIELGARGIWHPSISDALLSKSIQKIIEGELWIDRSVTHYIVSHMLFQPANQGVAGKHSIAPSLDLTEREQEIVALVARGKCDKVIAWELGISPNTVKNHLSSIYRKLQVTSRYQLGLVYNGLTTH